MITVESFLSGLKEEKQKMVEELAVLNGRREQLRDDINRFNFAISQIELEQRRNNTEE